MKILQINCVYNKGSTGKIMYDIHSELLKSGNESVICYGRGAKTTDPSVYKVCSEIYSKFNNLLSRFTGLEYGGCHFSTSKLISVIKREKPDTVIVHCINGYFVNIYNIIRFLKESKIKTVLVLHAEFMHTANCSHAMDCMKWVSGCEKCARYKKESKSLFFDRARYSWNRMKKSFEGFEGLKVVSVSPWLKSRAEQSPFFKGAEQHVVLNGLDTTVFKQYDTSDLELKYKTNGEKIIFYVTPKFDLSPDHIKGGYYLLELAKRLQNENIKLLVAGQYEKGINVPDNVVLLGRVSNQAALAKYYSFSDLTVLTSKRETFSMVCAESLSCGTPVIGFKAGAPEQISIEEFSSFVEYGDVDGLVKETKKFLYEKELSCEGISKQAHIKYSKERMAEEYIRLL
ncbi:MAG: glycosyltransferase [Clostridia bacterium]|nr:glycosyltransferase [Clostridia bacterium]